MLKWEWLESVGGYYPATLRAKVPGGWLVYAERGECTAGLTFYPDPRHEWDGSSLP